MELRSCAESGHWDYSNIAGLDGILTLPVLNVSLALTDIYVEIDSSQEADEKRRGAQPLHTIFSKNELRGTEIHWRLLLDKRH